MKDNGLTSCQSNFAKADQRLKVGDVFYGHLCSVASPTFYVAHWPLAPIVHATTLAGRVCVSRLSAAHRSYFTFLS